MNKTCFFFWRDVADIDLYAGGLSESTQRKNQNPTVVGPTFQCILMEQFLRTKIGDRYSFRYNSNNSTSIIQIFQ